MSINLDKSLILRKIKKELKLKSDADFARFLGVKPQTLASWYSRNTYDTYLLYSKCERLNPHWLLTGEGSMLKDGDPTPAVAPSPIYKDKYVALLEKQVEEKDEQIKALHDLLAKEKERPAEKKKTTASISVRPAPPPS